MTASAIERDAAIFESPDDRLLIKMEADADPAFAKVLQSMLKDGVAGEERVVQFAQKAVVNELDPRQFPETKGAWPKLRAKVRQLVDELPGAIIRHIDQMPPEKRVAAAQALREGKDFDFPPITLGELGQFDIIGSIVGAVAGAATSVYGSYLQSSTQRSIVNMELSAQQKEVDAQLAMANAQKAMAAASASQAGILPALPTAITQPIQAAASALGTDIGGVPLWMLLLGLYLSFHQAK